MPTWQRGYLTACVAVIAGALTYVLCDFGAWPKWIYLPYDRSWIVAARSPDASGSVYLGMIAWGLLGTVVGGGLAWVGLGVRTKPVGRRLLRLSGAWAITAFAFGAVYFTWSLWPF